MSINYTALGSYTNYFSQKCKQIFCDNCDFNITKHVILNSTNPFLHKDGEVFLCKACERNEKFNRIK